MLIAISLDLLGVVVKVLQIFLEADAIFRDGMISLARFGPKVSTVDTCTNSFGPGI
jgi:hypothetical protein